ncbi:MAG TPA: hypothetical protein VHC43_02965 [Mycobacteriales bacterium]|nr:hypothetical protein [Mycobacteriales bacterium]
MTGTGSLRRALKRWASAATVIGATTAVLASPLSLGTAAAATTAVTINPAGTTTTMAHGGTATVNYTVTTDGTETGASTFAFASGPDGAGPNPTLSCSETAPVANVFSGSCTFTNVYAGAGPDVLRITNGAQHADATVALTGAETTDTSVTIDANSQNTNQPAGSTATLNVHYSPVVAGQDAPLIRLTNLGGPNPSGTDGTAFPAGAPCLTRLDGTATCSLRNANGAGQDTVEALADNNNDGVDDATPAPADVVSPSTLVTFSGAAAGVTITAPSNSATTGTCIVYTITATDAGGRASAGDPITVTMNQTVTGTPSAPEVTFFNADCSTGADQRTGATDNGDGTFTVSQTKTVQTGSDGTVKIGVAAGNAGPGSVTATAAGNISGSQPMNWSVGGVAGAAKLLAVPASRTQYTSTVASYTVGVTDSTNNPIEGVQVNRETTSGPDSLTPAACGTTHADGTTTCSVPNGGSPGTDAITFWVDNNAPGNHTTGPDSNEPQTTATAVFNAQPTFTSDALTCVQQLAGANQGTGVQNCTVPTTQKSVTFAEILKNNGTPVSGAIVDFTATAAVVGGQAISAANLPSGSATTDVNGIATFTINDPNPAAGDGAIIQAKVGATSAGTSSASWQTPVATALAVTPQLQTVTKGGVVTVTAQVTDQFGAGVSGSEALNYSVVGRNNGKGGTVTTGPAGTATISYTDTGVNAASTSDTISVIDTTHPFNGSATVQYVNGSTAASVITIDTSGSGTSDATCTATGHTAATNVALGTTTTVCALVKNSTGEVLAGKPVTFTMSNGQVAKQGALTPTSTTSVTVAADAAGFAFADVTSTKSGAHTVTASADSATASSTVTYQTPTSDKARTIKIAPASTTITRGTSGKFTATVTDAFGNPVANVGLQFTQSGPGNIAGSSSATLTTAADGTASVTVTTAATDSGPGSVVATISAGGAGSQCGQLANQGTPPAATAGACTATATYTVSAPVVATSVVVQAAGPRKVGDQELIAATVTNSDGTPAVGQLVRFRITGANSASGSGTTTPKGVAFFAYTPVVGGTDHVFAYDDVNNNGSAGSGEPSGTLNVSVAGGAKEHPGIRLTSHAGVVTIHVSSHPALAHAKVTYYVERLGHFHKIGVSRTGSAGRAHLFVHAKVGKKLKFRAKVSGKSGVRSGKSRTKSIRVKA